MAINWTARSTDMDKFTVLGKRVAIYAALFFLGHTVAIHWGGPQYFSMWYPAAGVRFAALWLWGPSWIIPMLAVEIVIQIATDYKSLEYGVIPYFVAILRAPVSYAIAILTIKRWAKIDPSNPMQLALAVLFGPALVSLTTGVWGWLNPHLPPYSSGEPLILIVTTFMIGDLLGVILIAPLFIWLHHYVAEPSVVFKRPKLLPHQYLEMAAIFCVGSVLAILFLKVDPSLSLMPIILTVAWIGTRFGRIASWIALAASAAAILAWSIDSQIVADRYEFHIGIAMTAISGILAGSFSDAQLLMRQEIQRRDRLLFQAERLKSVKAMSLAVIHDASQPLTTLTMETEHLVNTLSQTPADLAEAKETSLLIQRKVHSLAELILRMRRFGGREDEGRKIFALEAIIDDAIALLQPELRKSGTQITLRWFTDNSHISGYSVELTQAIYNLMHNAFQSAPHSGFQIGIHSFNNFAEIQIQNGIEPDAPKNNGFGVGYYIARSIIEAHDGSVTLENCGEQFYTIIKLPEALAHDARRAGN